MAGFTGAVRRGLKRRLVVWGIAGLVIAWLVGFMFFNMSLPRNEPSITDKDDGIVVLTGGDQRLRAAMDLLNRGYGRRLLVTGVNRATARAKLKSFMAKSTPGLFDCCVDLGREAQDTIGNAQETASWVVKNDYHSIVVVTASYHMPRAMTELRYAVPPSCRLIPYPVFTDSVRLTDWWRWSGTTRLLAEEYTKYLASVARISLMRAILKISGS